jgi:hypothetical protein
MSESDRSEGTLRPGTAEFLSVLAEIGALHKRKTLDYGQDEDALSNIRSSSDVINVSPWAGCILRISDKMHRLRSFFRRGRVEFDGVEDTLLDIACYAVIALVLYREGKRCKAQPSPRPLLPTTACESSTGLDVPARPTAGQALRARLPAT